MATDGTAATAVPQPGLDARLDAIDRTLLGLLPRGERLELVSNIEARIREIVAAGDHSAEEVLHEALPVAVAGSGIAPTSTRRRSRLAVTAGIAGIVSVALMLSIPVVYVLTVTVASSFDLNEMILVGLIGLAPLLTLAAGTAAVVLGIAGLVQISRKSGRLQGRGWAITGICTGPLPVMAACLPLLLIIVPLLLSSVATVTTSPTFTSASTCTNCGHMPVSPSPSYAQPPGYATPSAATVSPYAVPPQLPAASYTSAPTPQTHPYSGQPATLAVAPTEPPLPATPISVPTLPSAPTAESRTPTPDAETQLEKNRTGERRGSC